MTPKEQAAMQQALEALEHYGIEGTKSVGGIKCTAAITALREALAQPQGEWVDLTDDDISDTYAIWWRQKHVFGSFTHAAIAKFKEKNTPPVVPQGEPVAWALSHSLGIEFSSKYPMQATKEAAEQMAREHMGKVVVTPLCAAPVRTKDLTDGEIADVFRAIHMKESWSLDFARAVIAADRRKNK